MYSCYLSQNGLMCSSSLIHVKGIYFSLNFELMVTLIVLFLEKNMMGTPTDSLTSEGSRTIESTQSGVDICGINHYS